MLKVTSCYKQPTLTFVSCNPLVPKTHNSECQNQIFALQIKPVKVNLKLIDRLSFLHPRH